MSTFKLALIQLAVTASKADNLLRAAKLVKEAAGNGAKIVALPECFNSPYGVNYFKEYAENIPQGSSCDSLRDIAKSNNVYLIGGSIPELGEDNKLYNTCTIWEAGTGALIGKHQKMHLFDIDIPGKISFQESSVLSSGSKFTCVDTGFCKIGVGICYDLRFPEMAQFYRQAGCHLLVYPGAFNMTTGPAHWQILQQGRAVDNQVYVATVSPARDNSASYVAYGNSMVVNPWGEIIERADGDESIIYADIDLNRIKEVREQIPIGHQRRTDLYNTIFEKN